MKGEKVGSLKYHVVQLNSSSVNMTLKEVNHVPALWVNLFSISKALKKGFNLSNKWLMLILKEESVSVTFDRIIRTLFVLKKSPTIISKIIYY
jgi:hypothetical protein